MLSARKQLALEDISVEKAKKNKNVQNDGSTLIVIHIFIRYFYWMEDKHYSLGRFGAYIYHSP